jgi:hypothetical protein
MEDELETACSGSLKVELRQTKNGETVHEELDEEIDEEVDEKVDEELLEELGFAKHTPLLDHPRPRHEALQYLWTAGLKEIPYFTTSPWNFYEPFLDLGALCLVACNNRSTVRALKVFSSTSWDATFTPLLRILHQSFVDVHEIYFFDREVFVITEHVGLSLEDMLENSVCLSEPDIAYIIGKVSLTLSLSTLYSSDVLDFGRYMLHLV